MNPSKKISNEAKEKGITYWEMMEQINPDKVHYQISESKEKDENRPQV